MPDPVIVTGPVAAAPDDLDTRVRQVDPDRWLASRFVGDSARRKLVIAICALNDELARIGETVTQALTGEIRLAWWRDRIEELFQGRDPAGQPALLALAGPIRVGDLPMELFEALVEARHADLEPQPFADDAALVRYLDGTAGAVMGLAVRALDPEAPLRAVVEAGRAWGLAGLYRARPYWRERGRDWLPPSWRGVSDDEVALRVRAEVESALEAARKELKALPVAAFPGVAYATLAGPYARGRTPGELERRIRLIAATVRGRI